MSKAAIHWDEDNIKLNDEESLQANRMKITEPKTPFHYLEEDGEPAAYPPKAAAAEASGERVHDHDAKGLDMGALEALTSQALERRQEQPDDDEEEHAKKFAEHRSNHYKLQGGQSLAELRKLAAAAMDEEDEDERGPPTRVESRPSLMADDDAHDDIGIENGFAQGDDEDFKAAIKAREAQCTPQLLRESPGQALKIALQDPPYNTRTMAVKELSAMVAVKALLAIKEAEASQALAALSAEELDVLMKYLYRGLAMPKRDQEHYKGLLKWHPKVLATAGPASIVRVMAEVGRPL